jgi:hypothetical protein
MEQLRSQISNQQEAIKAQYMQATARINAEASQHEGKMADVCNRTRNVVNPSRGGHGLVYRSNAVLPDHRFPVQTIALGVTAQPRNPYVREGGKFDTIRSSGTKVSFAGDSAEGFDQPRLAQTEPAGGSMATRCYAGARRFGAGASSVRACLGRLSALSVLHSQSVLYGAFVWDRRALNSPKRWLPARADGRRRGFQRQV